MNKFFKVLAISSVVLTMSNAAHAVCLDYWIKGPAACKEQEEQKNKIVIKGLKKGQVLDVEKDEERIQYEMAMDKKVDEFLANYGKPPREFVYFHLDPTLENGIRWVKKFNTEHERTMKIAVAWRQADKIFKEYKTTGQLTLPAESGVTEKQIKYLMEALEENPTDLPEVETFGLPLDRIDKDRMSRDYAKLDYKEETMAKAASKLSNTGASSLFSLEKMEEKAAEDRRQYNSVMNSKAESKTKSFLNKKADRKELTDGYPIKVSYFFSDKCPFCKKFKSEINSAVKQLGKDKVQMTCIDMTPGDRKKEHAEGIACDYREILPNEARQFGIKRTPSLLVKRNNSKSYELLENYHEKQVLLDYFMYGVAK